MKQNTTAIKFAVTILIFIFITTFSINIFALGAPNTTDPIEIMALDAMKKAKIPTASIMYIKNGQQPEYLNLGLDNRFKEDFVYEENYLYPIGSLSKSYTALGLLVLEQRGLVSLDDPITKYIPWFNVTYNKQSVTANLKLSNLVHQTSGFTNDESKYKFPKDENATIEQIVKHFNNSKLAFEPGEKFAYSNINYIISAYIIEQVSGIDYNEFMQQNILQPLDMNNTFTNFNDAISTRMIENGHKLSFMKPSFIYEPVAPAKIPSGYIHSTIADQAKWASAHMGLSNVNNEISQAIEKSHESDLSVQSTNGYHYGAGWFVSDDQNIIYHPGGTINYSSMTIMDLKNNTAVCVLANLNSASGVEYIAKNIMNILNDQPLNEYSQDIMLTVDTIFTILTVVSVILIALFLLGYKLKPFNGNIFSKGSSSVFGIVFFSILTLAIITMIIIFPSFFAATWQHIVLWMSPSVITGFIGILTFSIITLCFQISNYFLS